MKLGDVKKHRKNGVVTYCAISIKYQELKMISNHYERAEFLIRKKIWRYFEHDESGYRGYWENRPVTKSLNVE
jgi:hypothetical protein